MIPKMFEPLRFDCIWNECPNDSIRDLQVRVLQGQYNVQNISTSSSFSACPKVEYKVDREDLVDR